MKMASNRSISLIFYWELKKCIFRYTNKKDICNVETGLKIFSNDTQSAIGLFKEFSADKIDTHVLEYDDHIRWK